MDKGRVFLLVQAEKDLKAVRAFVKLAGAKQTKKKVDSALKSIGGAIRHARMIE